MTNHIVLNYKLVLMLTYIKYPKYERSLKSNLKQNAHFKSKYFVEKKTV